MSCIETVCGNSARNVCDCHVQFHFSDNNSYVDSSIKFQNFISGVHDATWVLDASNKKNIICEYYNFNLRAFLRIEIH